VMSMSLQLPPAVDLYVKMENAGDPDAVSSCFAANATVRDEGHTYEGLDAIKKWKAETKERYNHTIYPLAVSHREGKTILIARVSGNFPGSPVTLEFAFAIERGKIVAMQIQAAEP
jgi:SnoaL-like domain